MILIRKSIHWFGDDGAQSMVEYLLIVSLVVLMVVGIFGAFVHHLAQ